MAAFSMPLQNNVSASNRPAWKSGKESKEQRPRARATENILGRASSLRQLIALRVADTKCSNWLIKMLLPNGR
jgi:hypothetical protein